MNGDWLVAAAFIAGFFGGTHCIGMCGAIVLLFEQQPEGALRPWVRRLSYNTGRLGFYALLGAVAGAGGAILTKVSGINTGLIVLRLLAGLLVIAIGVNLLFDWSATRFLEKAGAGIWHRLAPLAKHVMPVSSPARALGAGFIWGALPCGLVYSAVAMAATTGQAVGGIAVMFAFWAGTLPALVLAGAGAEQLQSIQSNTLYRRVAGVVVIVIGLFALMPVARMLPAVI